MSIATIPATTTTTTTTGELTTIRPRLGRVAVRASLVGAAVAEGLSLVARGLDVPMRAADPGAAAAKAIPVGGVAMAVLMNAAIGLVLAAALARWTKSPARTFATIATTYAVLSLLGPAFAAHTELATKVVLSFTHVIAAVVIIPPIVDALRAARR